WRPGSGMRDLGSLSSGNSYGKALNNHAHVVGYSAVGSADHAFLWKSGEPMRDLGTLGGLNSYAKGINDAGVVVGQSDTAAGPRAFVWAESLGMQDVNPLVENAGGWLVEGGLSVNESGYILALARNARGRVHAVLLLPDQPYP